jgi:hypothetical protein
VNDSLLALLALLDLLLRFLLERQVNRLGGHRCGRTPPKIECLGLASEMVGLLFCVREGSGPRRRGVGGGGDRDRLRLLASAETGYGHREEDGGACGAVMT